MPNPFCKSLRSQPVHRRFNDPSDHVDRMFVASRDFPKLFTKVQIERSHGTGFGLRIVSTAGPM